MTHVLQIGPITRGHGSARVMHSWARILHRAGYSLHVIPDPPNPPQDDLVYPPGTHVHRLLKSRDRGWRPSSWYEPIARTIGAVLDAHDIRLIMTHAPHQCFIAARHSRGIPLLATWHSPMVAEDRINSWEGGTMERQLTFPLRVAAFSALEMDAIGAANAIHTLSAFTWQLLCERYPTARTHGRWVRIPGTFDDARYRPAADRMGLRRALGLPTDVPILFSLRRLVYRNAPERIVDAAHEAQKARLPALFVIGGVGPLKPKLQELVQRHGLRDSVKLLGLVPEEDLPRYYQAADVTLMPTRALECFGLPAIESMGCGTPCLTTPCGALTEVNAPFPSHLAEANSGAAFTDLVLGWLRGARRTAPRDAVAAYAQGQYSEAAVMPAIEGIVEALAGPPRHFEASKGAPGHLAA